MSGGLITIIILIAVVWQIVTAVIAHAQQQKQRQAEAEARRQHLASRGGQSSPATMVGGPSSQQQPKMSKLDELAARRQQQLDELRRRRESGRPTTSPTSRARSSTAGPSTPSTSQWESSTQLRAGQAPSGVDLPIDLEPRRVPGTSQPRRISPGQKQQQLQEQQRLARQRQQQQQQQQQQQARLRQAEELARRQRQEEQVPSPYAAGEIGVAAARRSEREAYGIAVPRLPDEQIRIGRVQQLLQNRATLRELIVMKEILDQPVSLREPRRV